MKCAKITRTVLIVFLVTGCIVQAVYSQSRHEEILSHFYRGNLLYEKADYAEAIKEYQHILTLGYESSSLYYNLGNSYVKNGQLPEALFNYEKALRLAPRDRDIHANHSYARSLVRSDGYDRKPRGIAGLPLYMFRAVSLDELTLVMSSLYWLLIAVAIVALMGRFSRQKAGIIGVALLVSLFLAGFAFCQRIGRLGKEAVVLDETLPVRFEPLETATVYFELSASSKTGLISCKNDWCKIERADKKKGWVRKQGLAIF